MIQILLVHNRFRWSNPVTWLSYMIRVATCSKWNHVAILADGYVIESIGKGVCVSDFDTWAHHSDRVVLPLTPTYQVDAAKILSLKGQPYGFRDLVQHFRHIVATRWNGKPEWKGKNFSGYVCSELACMLIGKDGFITPADFAYMPDLIHGEEFETKKLTP